MTKYLETLLADVFAEQGKDSGVDREKAVRLAAAATKTLLAVGIVSPRHLERFERESKIYDLRKSVVVSALALRFDCTPRQIWRAVGRVMAQRRAVLRSMGEDRDVLDMAG